MTDTETVETVAPPKPVRRPAPRRKPAPARQDEVVDVATMAAQLAAMQAKIAELERGGTRFIETEPAPKPTMREASLEAVTPFTRKLLTHTHDVPEHGIVDREPAYNVPLRWYLRRDGTYARLQGDAKNRAMYEDLGFYLLTPAEAADYELNERPGQVRLENTRSSLINGLRQLVRRENTLSGYIDDMKWDESLAEMSIPRLEEEWHNLCRQTANPDRRLPTAERYRQEQDPNAGLLAGVETGRSVEDLERKLSAPGAQTRTIEITQKNAHMFS